MMFNRLRLYWGRAEPWCRVVHGEFVSDHQHEKTGASVAKSLAPLFIGWALLLGAVTLGFNVFLEHRENPNQLRLASAGNDASSLVLQQNFAGHYLVNGEINGRGVEFMLDTGATLVAVPGALAARLGLRHGPPVQMRTANGMSRAYMTRIERLQFGPFVFHDVDASIVPGMEGDQALMGMSLLKQLELTQRGQALTLRVPQS